MYFYYSGTSASTISPGYPSLAYAMGETKQEVTTVAPRYIYRAYTVINPVYWRDDGRPFVGGYDLESVITHELGHWVWEADPHRFEEYGLGPAQSWPWATMWGYLSPGETQQRSLAAEDIDGIRSLYGRRQ